MYPVRYLKKNKNIYKIYTDEYDLFLVTNILPQLSSTTA